MAKIDELRERLALLNASGQKIRQTADDEGRDLNAQEASDLDDILAQFERTKADIDRLSVLEAQTETLTAGMGRRTEPEPPVDPDDEVEARPPVKANLTAGGRQTLQRERLSARPYRPAPGNWNFNSLGEFAMSVRNACLQKGGEWDPRLIVSERLAAATIYGSEGVGADGGFAVPPDFRTTIMEAVMGEQSLVARCDQVTVAGNSFSAPIDMTTPWQSSGGIQAYWGGEGGLKTQSKPALQERVVKLNKLYSLIPMTDDLVEDAPAMESYLRRKAPEKIAFEVNRAILTGNGVGKPLGVYRSAALVSVAKEPGQQADTLVGNNIIKMFSRLSPESMSRAVWVINPNILPQLLKLSLPGTDNTGNSVTGWGAMAYMPPNGLSGSPFGTLFGRPIIMSQAASTLGDQGDIGLIDFSQYLVILKGGVNPKVDVSIHLWFDYDMTAFRFVLRIGGIPWWDSSIVGGDGTTTYSPLVTLDDRA